MWQQSLRQLTIRYHVTNINLIIVCSNLVYELNVTFNYSG